MFIMLYSIKVIRPNTATIKVRATFSSHLIFCRAHSALRDPRRQLFLLNHLHNNQQLEYSRLFRNLVFSGSKIDVDSLVDFTQTACSAGEEGS